MWDFSLFFSYCYANHSCCCPVICFLHWWSCLSFQLFWWSQFVYKQLDKICVFSYICVVWHLNILIATECWMNKFGFKCLYWNLLTLLLHIATFIWFQTLFMVYEQNESKNNYVTVFDPRSCCTNYCSESKSDCDFMIVWLRNFSSANYCSWKTLSLLNIRVKIFCFIQALPIPWRKFLTSLPLCAITVTHFGQAWGFYTILNELPTYMANVLHFDIKQVRGPVFYNKFI